VLQNKVNECTLYNLNAIYPASWINGYDKNRHVKDNLYDFVAIPTLFLLDKDKRVLLKDVNLIMVERYLRSL
jgi:hypothetical protein